MRVIYDFGVSRVIHNGKSPIEHASDIIVQIRAGNDWRDVCGFNSLSNDYAYTSAKEEAQRRAKAVAE